MKAQIKILIPSVLFLFLALTASGQKNIRIDTLHVTGVCEMCQKRIEKAASIRGVKIANWDQATQLLTVYFVTGKTDLNEIAGVVAEHGHDNALQKASEKAYNELPDCCAYRDGVKVH